MKLIIQIPCYNEAKTLAVALAALPRRVEGFDSVEWLVIDDGSVDDTSEVARACGVDHIVRHTGNQGLARAFMTGIKSCLRHGADVIINTDADNQYDASYIPDLLRPILDKRADIVVGARPLAEIKHFSLSKKLLQGFGSWVVRKASKTDVRDAPSGFRAFTREAALRFNVFSDYTYTLETLIQAGQSRFAVCSVPVGVNGFLRPSRLMKSTFSYVKRSMFDIIRIFVVYCPLVFWWSLAAFFFIIGGLLGVRFLFFYGRGAGAGHVQSLILSSMLVTLSAFIGCIAFISDMLAANRKQLEEIQYYLRGEYPGNGRKQGNAAADFPSGNE